MVAKVIQVAGRPIDSPADILRDYANRHGRTVREFDLAGLDCGANEVCIQEIKRTRIIASRVSNEQATAMLSDAEWSHVPQSARLEEANPDVRGGVYDHMLSLYEPLLEIRGVGHAKASKLLHLKRPALFPILDSKLMSLYRAPAAEWAKRYPSLGYRYLFWVAIRDDVIRNRAPLKTVRVELRRQGGILKQMATMSDLRILDILAWKL